MARSQYYHDPARKHIEVYQDSSGGLNTVNANGTLKDNELQNIVNRDLGVRGSTTRRTGTKTRWTPPAAGTPQGYFRYFKADGTYDEIEVVGGAFYVNGTAKTVGTGTVIQSTREMEAVQYKSILYIASGSGLLQWDGATLDFVTPYNPTPLEALYVGTNALMTDPDDFIQNGTAAVLKIKGVRFDKRYGVVNDFVTIDVFADSPSGSTVEWKIERKAIANPDSEDWFISQDWAADNSHTFSTSFSGDFIFRISARRSGQESAEDTYIVAKYTIKPTSDPNDKVIDNTTINECNRIFLHWERLVMYGDGKGDVIYVSDLQNPQYFPMVNTLRFENPRKEALTKLVRYRDSIVAFTPTTTQALFGKSPYDFKRVMMNSEVGCIAPNSAQVVENHIIFLSYSGVQVLKSVTLTETKANVEIIDTNVSNQVFLDSDACAVVHDNQYQIIFPQRNRRLRYYYKWGVWTKDESTKIDYTRVYLYDNDVFYQGADGRIVEDDSTLYTDEGVVYEDKIEFKSFNFSQPYATKKMRELQLMVAEVDTNTNITVDIYADENVVASEVITVTADGQPVSINGILGEVYKIRAAGKGLFIKTVITHNEALPLQIIGLGFIFKLKKP